MPMLYDETIERAVVVTGEFTRSSKTIELRILCAHELRCKFCNRQFCNTAEVVYINFTCPKCGKENEFSRQGTGRQGRLSGV